ncbi:MAG: hypothetical protein VX519_05305 [Myxococcota bacterium]|nr:hypothetical protein [Myxococcota bacterium]
MWPIRWNAWIFVGLVGCLPSVPEREDYDNDGLTEAQEAELGTDPNNPDTDDDGWTDLEEYEQNTDPTDEDDMPYMGGWAIDACRDDVESTGNSVGDISENFSLEDQHGEMVDLHDFCNRVVLLKGAAEW